MKHEDEDEASPPATPASGLTEQDGGLGYGPEPQFGRQRYGWHLRPDGKQEEWKCPTSRWNGTSFPRIPVDATLARLTGDLDPHEASKRVKSVGDLDDPRIRAWFAARPAHLVRLAQKFVGRDVHGVWRWTPDLLRVCAEAGPAAAPRLAEAAKFEPGEYYLWVGALALTDANALPRERDVELLRALPAASEVQSWLAIVFLRGLSADRREAALREALGSDPNPALLQVARAVTTEECARPLFDLAVARAHPHDQYQGSSGGALRRCAELIPSYLIERLATLETKVASRVRGALAQANNETAARFAVQKLGKIPDEARRAALICSALFVAELRERPPKGKKNVAICTELLALLGRRDVEVVGLEREASRLRRSAPELARLAEREVLSGVLYDWTRLGALRDTHGEASLAWIVHHIQTRVRDMQPVFRSENGLLRGLQVCRPSPMVDLLAGNVPRLVPVNEWFREWTFLSPRAWRVLADTHRYDSNADMALMAKHATALPPEAAPWLVEGMRDAKAAKHSSGPLAALGDAATEALSQVLSLPSYAARGAEVAMRLAASELRPHLIAAVDAGLTKKDRETVLAVLAGLPEVDPSADWRETLAARGAASQGALPEVTSPLIADEQPLGDDVKRGLLLGLSRLRGDPLDPAMQGALDALDTASRAALAEELVIHPGLRAVWQLYVLGRLGDDAQFRLLTDALSLDGGVWTVHQLNVLKERACLRSCRALERLSQIVGPLGAEALTFLKQRALARGSSSWIRQARELVDESFSIGPPTERDREALRARIESAMRIGRVFDREHFLSWTATDWIRETFGGVVLAAGDTPFHLTADGPRTFSGKPFTIDSDVHVVHPAELDKEALSALRQDASGPSPWFRQLDRECHRLSRDDSRARCREERPATDLAPRLEARGYRRGEFDVDANAVVFSHLDLGHSVPLIVSHDAFYQRGSSNHFSLIAPIEDNAAVRSELERELCALS